MKAYENPNSVFEGDRQKRVRVSQHRDGSKKRRYKNAKTETDARRGAAREREAQIEKAHTGGEHGSMHENRQMPIRIRHVHVACDM